MPFTRSASSLNKNAQVEFQSTQATTSISPNKRTKSLDRTTGAKTPKKSTRKLDFKENNTEMENFQPFHGIEDLNERMDMLLMNFFNSGKSRAKKTEDSDDEMNQDENFLESLSKTSSKKSIQGQVKCDLARLKNCFESVDSFLPNSIKEKINRITNDFSRWTEWLVLGRFNLLVHGVGSKYDLLMNYANSQLTDYYYIAIEGFRASVTAKPILQAVVDLLNLNIKSRADVVGWSREISREISSKQTDVFIILHNIDGVGLRDPTQQQALAELAKCYFIHFVASIDHVNATLIWDETTSTAFRWLRVNTSTMLCYKKEILAGDSKLLGLNSNAAVRTHTFGSLDAIWQSLTKNARATLKKLAECFADSNNSLDFFEFYQKIKAEFYASSEAVLRKILVEFTDHQLIRQNVNIIYLTIDKDLLISYIANKIDSVE